MPISRLAASAVLGATMFAMGGGLAPAHAQEKPTAWSETEIQRKQRMAWWREARFGMFIHWGIYSLPAGEWEGKHIGGNGEWILFSAQLPVSQYETLVKRFNPVKFDARAWVRLAKSAGMKYIVITTKHHDGFCLFDSKLTDYDIMSTPFRRDIMKELAEAARAEGLTICWYYSIIDWDHPDYLPRGPGSKRPWDTRPTRDAQFDRYLAYMEGQLRELLSNYGRIGVVWFDGGWEYPGITRQRIGQIVDGLRAFRPEIIINDRICYGGDFRTPEQTVPAARGPAPDWETCMTLNDTWGYRKDDHNWKPAETILRNLIDIASKGGNYLLNVGPTAEGVIPPESVERLQAIGRWMATNGEAIYGTTASPFSKPLPWGRATCKPGRIYLHVLDWPHGALDVPGLKNRVQKAYLLADASKAALEVQVQPDRVQVKLPAAPLDPVATVVVLEIEGEPRVD